MNVQQTQDGNIEESLIRKYFAPFNKLQICKLYNRTRNLTNQNKFVDNMNEMLIGEFPGETKHILVLTQQKMIPTPTIKKKTSIP